MTAHVTVRVPSALAAAIEGEIGPATLPRWATEALVAEGVREGILSVGEAGEILGLGYFEAEAFLKAKGVPVLLSDEEFAREGADLRAMFPNLASR